MTRKVKTKLPCGCEHDDRQWLKECEKHKKEEDERHERVAEEWRRRDSAPSVDEFKD